MPDRIMEYSTLTMAWVFTLSVFGGVASYVRKINGGIIKRFSIVELVGELVISGFSGIMAFLICDSFGVDAKLTAAIVGISGHMGSRTIFIIEHYANKKIQSYMSKNND